MHSMGHRDATAAADFPARRTRARRYHARMRAVGVRTFGGPEVLEVVELPIPEPGPGEVRIRVAAATVNPTDIGLRSGNAAAALADKEPPYVPGMEAAGTIDAVGSGSPWNAGDEGIAIVVPQHAGRGAQAELLVVAD